MTNDRQCAQVPKPSPSEIKGCNFYLSINECQACNLNTYQKSGLCRPINFKNRIQDCSLMDEISTCQICDLKLPSYNQTYCEKPKKSLFDNCLLIRHPISCKTCKPGYKKDKNYFLNNLNNVNFVLGFFEKVGFWREIFFDIGIFINIY